MLFLDKWRAFSGLFVVVFGLSFSLGITGCGTDEGDVNVIARVNGRPITLAQLEAKYDLFQLDSMHEFTPSVVRLRTDYGMVLGDLIVLELVKQDLEDRGLVVTDEEVAAAEQEVRRDYPPETFEQTLVEEYIDIGMWRVQLRARLSLERFFQEVLRAKIKLDFEEAKKYYQDHVADFYLPPRIDFIAFHGPDRAMLQDAVTAFQKTKNIEGMPKLFPQVQANSMKMREDRLPPAWLLALKELAVGQASAVFADKSGFQVFMLMERLPGKYLEPSQAYPAIEKILVEKKMNVLFEAWLQKRLAKSKVEVSVHLLEEFNRNSTKGKEKG